MPNRQVLGVAYSFAPSLGMRKKLTAGIQRYHSAKHSDFSYFWKGWESWAVTTGEPLLMQDGGREQYWPEPELAVRLGPGHRIESVTVANDFTAFSVELRGRDDTFDGTRLGKAWPGSCALGHHWQPASDPAEILQLTVSMRIMRGGRTIYDHAYKMQRIRHAIAELPDRIVALRASFGDRIPSSKVADLDTSGRLCSGTILLLGTGIIVPPECYTQDGDVIEVSCPGIDSITNRVECVEQAGK